MSRSADFAILIPTRNRPVKVRKLLESISSSKVMPKQVVIVASGTEISEEISLFQERLPITYIFSKQAGQVNQKKLGLAAITPKIAWVVFLDDDVLVKPDTFSSAFESLNFFEKTKSEQIVGVGLGITSSSRSKSAGCFLKILGSFFLLYKNKPGLVLSSGHATSYQECIRPVFTAWLNGVSMWRRENAMKYSCLGINSKYAACEDLIYSYSQSKFGELLYLPQSIVTYQDIEITNFESMEVIESGALNRMSFVLSNSELSKWRCAWSQIGRCGYAIVVRDQNGSRNLKFHLKLILKMIFVCFRPSTLEEYLGSIKPN